MNVPRQIPTVDRATYALLCIQKNKLNLLCVEALVGYVGQSENGSFSTIFFIFHMLHIHAEPE